MTAFSESALISLSYIIICAITITVLYAIGFFIIEISNALHPEMVIIGLVIIFASLIIAAFRQFYESC